MPTLTPKGSLGRSIENLREFASNLPLQSLDYGTDPLLSNVEDNANKENIERLKYLDTMRGISCLMIVFHHFRCGFRPCQMFGKAVEWLSDPNECNDTHLTGNVIFNSWYNGTFFTAVFAVMSGFLLSHGLWKAPPEKWRVSVCKRFIRLAIPCGAALIFAYLLAGFTIHQDAAAITKSIWLQKMPMERPSPVTGLLGQIGWGVWHGTSTLNNAIWSMKFELFGSYLVFMLVVLLKGSPHRIRTRWLGGLFLLMLVPSSTRFTVLEARVTYSLIDELESGPGQKRAYKTTQRIVALDPVKHSHLLHKIHEKVNTGNNKDSSVLALKYTEAPPDPWYVRKDTIDANVIVLDKPMKKQHKDLSNTQIYRELVGAADPFNKNYGKPEIEMIKVTGWKSENPWLWYAPLVAGVWLSEHLMSTSSKAPMGGGVTVAGKPLVHGLAVLAFFCASYPYTVLEAGSSIHWHFMLMIASSLGLASVAHSFWSIIGAVAFVYYIVLHSDFLRRMLVVHPLLPKLGQLSFALYLTHIPILYTLTCAIFVFLYHFFEDFTVNATTASLIAFWLSLPVMFTVAFYFWRYVDQPAIEYSRIAGQQLLGLSEERPKKSRSKVPSGGETASTAASSTLQE